MNEIRDGDLYLHNAAIEKDIKKGQIRILIEDDYLKSLSYQKALREKRKFFISGDLLYALFKELLDHINEVFLRIRLTDVDVDDENRTLLFLRKFSRSSELISQKLSLRLSQQYGSPEVEVFEFIFSGLEKQNGFIKGKNDQNLLEIRIPSSFVYNRLISFLDKMVFSDLLRIREDIRKSFLEQFKELKKNVEEKKQLIDMKYALELAKERISMLVKDNDTQQAKINMLLTQNDLYKRSYFSLRKRLRGKSSESRSDDDLEYLEEIP